MSSKIVWTPSPASLHDWTENLVTVILCCYLCTLLLSVPLKCMYFTLWNSPFRTPACRGGGISFYLLTQKSFNKLLNVNYLVISWSVWIRLSWWTIERWTIERYPDKPLSKLTANMAILLFSHSYLRRIVVNVNISIFLNMPKITLTTATTNQCSCLIWVWKQRMIPNSWLLNFIQNVLEMLSSHTIMYIMYLCLIYVVQRPITAISPGTYTQQKWHMCNCLHTNLWSILHKSY